MASPTLQYDLRDVDKVFVLHLPKTAGTSFLSYIDMHYAVDEIFPYYFPGQLPAPETLEVAPYKLFRGHFLYGTIHDLLRTSPITLTLLRNPVERFISHFRHLQREKHYRLLGTEADLIRSMSLEQFVDDETLVMNWAFRNRQTQLIAGETDIETASNPAYYKRNAKTTLDERDLAVAKQRLEAFQFVGLTERFHESLALLAFTLGWRLPRNRHLNAGPSDFAVDQVPLRVLDRIAAHNSLDMALYLYATTLFEKRVAQMAQELTDRYGTYEETWLLEKHYAGRFAARHPPVRHCRVEMAAGISGTNWYPPEHHPNQGYFRWSGPDQLTELDLPCLVEGDATVKFLLLANVGKVVSLHLNGEAIALRSASIPTGGVVYEGIVRGSSLAKNRERIRLRFSVEQTVSLRHTPLAHFMRRIDARVSRRFNLLRWIAVWAHRRLLHQPIWPIDDQRMLGFALSWIELTHQPRAHNPG